MRRKPLTVKLSSSKFVVALSSLVLARNELVVEVFNILRLFLTCQYSINYDDFNIATDYSSLREHVTKIELAQKAMSTFAEKTAKMCEFDLRRVISALDSGQFEMAITPPVLKMGSSYANTNIQQVPNYTQYLGTLPVSSETASANDELYQRPHTC